MLLLCSCSVVSDPLRPHGLQHTRSLCPSPTPRAYSNSCSLMVMQPNYLILCHPLLLLPSFFFLASGSFPMSQFFTSCGHSIGVSDSASVLPMNIQDWFPWGWTGWISLQSKGLSRLLQHHSSKSSVLWHSAFFIVQLSHPYITTGKTIALDLNQIPYNYTVEVGNIFKRLDLIECLMNYGWKLVTLYRK